MKIALFTDTYDEVNGVANTFRYLAEYCRRKGKHLDVYAHAGKGDSVEELDSVRIFRYRPAIPIQIYFDMIFDLKIPRVRVFEQCKKENYDLVHTATPGSMGLNALIAAHFLKIPLAGSYHTALPDYIKRRVEKIAAKFQMPAKPPGRIFESATWKYMEWYYNQCKIVLAPSRSTKSELETRLKTKVGIFSRGIDTEKFHPRYREPHGDVVVLYVGRIAIEKNLGLLVDIFKDRKDARLVVVGDGPYLSEMQGLLKNAVFRGFLTGDKLSEAYASADIFVFPSTTDTFGNVILEAMSSGLPAIVTDRMGPKEIVDDGKSGFVAHSKGDFGNKLNLLISDEKLRKVMGKNAREYAVSRSWDAVFDELFGTYKAVAGK